MQVFVVTSRIKSLEDVASGPLGEMWKSVTSVAGPMWLLRSSIGGDRDQHWRHGTKVYKDGFRMTFYICQITHHEFTNVLCGVTYIV